MDQDVGDRVGGLVEETEASVFEEMLEVDDIQRAEEADDRSQRRIVRAIRSKEREPARNQDQQDDVMSEGEDQEVVMNIAEIDIDKVLVEESGIELTDELKNIRRRYKAEFLKF
jgi:hypothetical protein